MNEIIVDYGNDFALNAVTWLMIGTFVSFVIARRIWRNRKKWKFSPGSTWAENDN